MARTLAEEILVLLGESDADDGPLTIGYLSRRLGTSSTLTRLSARQLVAEGSASAVILDHDGIPMIHSLNRRAPAPERISKPATGTATADEAAPM